MTVADTASYAGLEPPSEGSPLYTIRAVDRTLDILDCLQGASSGVALGALSETIGLPKSSAFRYLATLEARGYVVRDPDETYRLGPASGPMRMRHASLLTAVARPRMEELCRRFEESICLGALDGTKVAYLAMSESSRAVRFAARPGHCDFIHSSALGKVLASRLPADALRRILAIEGMPAVTVHTITDRQAFLAEIGAVRTRGYAVNDRENDDVGRCVAVALPGPLAAAVSLSAPAARFPLERAPEVAAALQRATEDIAAEVARAGL
jgi:IclR family acetate operon transcriptional repressor